MKAENLKTLAIIAGTSINYMNAQNATTTETLTFDYIDKIIVSDNSNVKVNSAENNQNVIIFNKKGEAYIKDNTLYIQSKSKEDIMVKTNNKNIQKIILNDASNLTFNTTIESNHLEIITKDVSRFIGNVKCQNISIQTFDASRVELIGIADSLIISAKDASNQNLKNLLAKNVSASINDVSNVKVYAEESITATVKDASRFKIYGSAKNVNISVSDIARVSRSENKFLDLDSSSTQKKWTYKWGDFKSKRGWLGFAFGVSYYFADRNFNSTLPSPASYLTLDFQRSRNFQFNMYQHNFNLYKDKLSIAIGIGWDWRTYAFEKKVILNPDSSYTNGWIDTTRSIKYDLNALKLTYLQFPLLLELHPDIKRNMCIDIGIMGEWLIYSKTKRVFQQNSYNYEISRKDSYNLNPFQAKLYFSVGYKVIHLYAEYALTQMFLKNKGPEVYPFNAGIRFNFFN
jgi:hypothetical protein